MRSNSHWLKFHCAFSHGLVEYLRSLNLAAELHLSGNESRPDVFQSFGDFADGIDVVDGYVRLSDIPDVGYHAKSSLQELVKTLTDWSNIIRCVDESQVNAAVTNGVQGCGIQALRWDNVNLSMY